MLKPDRAHALVHTHFITEKLSWTVLIANTVLIGCALGWRNCCVDAFCFIVSSNHYRSLIRGLLLPLFSSSPARFNLRFKPTPCLEVSLSLVSTMKSFPGKILLNDKKRTRIVPMEFIFLHSKVEASVK